MKKDPHPSIDPGMGEIPVPEKRSYSMKEIQEILGVSKITALKLVQRNLFHTVRVGNRIRISKRSFDEWLDGQREGGKHGDDN